MLGAGVARRSRKYCDDICRNMREHGGLWNRFEPLLPYTNLTKRCITCGMETLDRKPIVLTNDEVKEQIRLKTYHLDWLYHTYPQVVIEEY